MNINKRGGTSSSDWKVLKDYAERYRDEIIKEIEIINSDIIVCGGTYWVLLDQVYRQYDKKRWEKNTRYSYCYEFDNKLFINIWHPSCRKSTDAYIEQFEKNMTGNDEMVSIVDLKREIIAQIKEMNDIDVLEEIQLHLL